jgi:acyl-CoA synthetase (AMP-forming)/AMP-acid ligase II
MILDHAADADTRLRFVRSCSSALSPQLMREAEARYGAPMVEAYGMTEATHQIACHNPPTADESAAGRPLREGFVPAPPPGSVIGIGLPVRARTGG